jgi:hypothetical protein
MEIEWKRSERDPLPFEKALSLEKDGWRLPNKDELKKAYDDKIEGFTETLYWTNEKYEENNSVWFVDFYQGIVSFCGETSKLFVRLVKEKK